MVRRASTVCVMYCRLCQQSHKHGKGEYAVTYHYHLIRRQLTLLDQSDYRLFITLFYIIFMPIRGSTYVNQPRFYVLSKFRLGPTYSRELYDFQDILPKSCIVFFSWLLGLKDASSPCVQRFAFQQYMFGRLRVLPIYKLLQHNNRHWGFNQQVQIGTPLEQSSTLKLFLLASAL